MLSHAEARIMGGLRLSGIKTLGLSKTDRACGWLEPRPRAGLRSIAIPSVFTMHGRRFIILVDDVDRFTA